MRETVLAVEVLSQEKTDDDPGPTMTYVSRYLSLDKPAGSRRVKTTLTLGYVVNLETHKGRPARLRIGEPLPDELEVLPTKDSIDAAIDGCNVADRSQASNPLPQTEPETVNNPDITRSRTKANTEEH